MQNNEVIEILKDLEKQYLKLIKSLRNQEVINKNINELKIKIENMSKMLEKNNVFMGTDYNYNKSLMSLKTKEEEYKIISEKIDIKFDKMKELILKINSEDIRNLNVNLNNFETLEEKEKSDKTIDTNIILIKVSIVQKELDVLKLALDYSIDLINEQENNSIDLVTHGQKGNNIGFLNMFVGRYKDFLNEYISISKNQKIRNSDYSICHDSLYEDINLYNSMYDILKNEITKKTHMNQFKEDITNIYYKWINKTERQVYNKGVYTTDSSSKIRLDNVKRMRNILINLEHVDKDIPQSLFLK